MRRITVVTVVASIALAAGCTVFPDQLPAWAKHSNQNNGGDGGTGGDDGGTSGDDGGTGDDGPVQPSNDPLATGVNVKEVAVFQAVKIDVMNNGSRVSPSSRNASVVASREALVRAYYTVDSSFQPKSVTGELTLSMNGQTLAVVKDSKTPSGSSSDASLESTFNFTVPNDKLPEGVQYSVAVADPSAPGTRDSSPSNARWPRDGSLEDLGAYSTGTQLKVQIVPVKYDADGSGRVPDTSASQLQMYQNAFYGMYPAAKVDISVHAPFPYSGAIDAMGSGWQEVLQALVDLRAQDGAPSDLYYMGMFEPAPSMQSYCGGGCIAGLCGLGTQPSDATVRACAGIGYSGAEAGTTAAHEVGHAHGRYHSPCGGASSPDPNYPYSGASIGVWGYDIVGHSLQNPSQATDIMGYCQPTWISDFTYEALFKRVQFVNGAHMQVGTHFATPQPYRFVSVDGSGNAKWGQATRLRDEPIAEAHTVTMFDASGAVVASVTGQYWAYDHLPGGYMLVPELGVGVERVSISGPVVNVASLAKTY